MSQPGRKPGINISGEVEGHLKKKSLLWHTVPEMLEAWPFEMPLSEEQLRNALSHLVTSGRAQRSGRGKDAKWKYKSKTKAVKVKDKPKAAKDVVGNIDAAIHEQVDQYISSTSNEPPEFLPQVALDVRASQVVDEVPLDEPDGTFKIQGSLVDGTVFRGTVVKMTSPGWSDRPYLVTEL